MKSLSAEDKAIGKDNYHEAVSVTRREFLMGSVLGTTAVSAAGLGAAYFKYDQVKDPVRVGVITMSVVTPGTTSCFWPISGIQSEWITSAELISNSTARSSGITSSFERTSPPSAPS